MVSWTEVKTTTISSDSINISSLEQLDRDDFGRLVVYFMDKVDSPNKSTITLGDIFERVFAKLTDSQYIDSLICKTSKVGFDIKNVEKYKTIHFKLVGSSCYAVRDEFPRLTKKIFLMELFQLVIRLAYQALTTIELRRNKWMH